MLESLGHDRGAIAKVVGSIAVRPFPSLWHSNATRTSLLMVKSRSSISSPGRWRGFCARCGSTLTCEGERSNETHFHVGAFRDAAQLQPTRHIFQEERLPWLHLGACGYAASPAACRWLSPPSVEFARHTTGIIGIISGAVRAGCTCRGEVSQRRDALGAVALACLPQVRADKRLRAMLEGLFDRNHDHRRRLLTVDSKTPLQGRIDADPGPTVDPICFVRPGNQEDQCDARVLHHVLDAVDPIVPAPIGDQQCATVILDLDEARLIPLGRAVEPLAAPCRQDKKRRGGDEGTSHRIDVVDLFPEDAL